MVAHKARLPETNAENRKLLDLEVISFIIERSD